MTPKLIDFWHGEDRAGRPPTGYDVMMEFIDRNGCTFAHPPGGIDETGDVLIAVAEKSMSEEDFVVWVAGRISPAD